MTNRIQLRLLALATVPLALALAACPGKDKKVVVQPPPLDTSPPKLDSVKANIPQALVDTFKPPPVRRIRPVTAVIPKAPGPRQAAVEREQAFSRFCYQEFGQKVDPKLQGGVALIVTVGDNGVSNVKVADDTWSSKAGQAVNTCLLPRAKEAWKLAPGAVKPGDYVVQLTFRGS
ncbi:MAG: hypothetical protein ABJD07_15020 [Gemmatimonadaceae bacterium]